MLLTVAIPTYNAMPYLPEAVDSILRQTYGDFRLLIVNDGSTDDSAQYLNSLSDPRVRVVHQDNIGVGATFRRILDLCETPFCARMDADDISHPERLAVQMDCLLRSPAVGLIGTQIAYLVGQSLVPALPFPTEHKAIVSAMLARRFPLCNPSLIFKTDVARAHWKRAIPGYGEDVDFVLRLCEATEAANTTQTLHLQRVHCTSATMTSSRTCAAGVRYGIHCARLRRQGLSEPDFEEYLAAGGLSGMLGRFSDWHEALATVHYRKYLISRATAAPLSAAYHLGVAGLCHPTAVLARASELIKRRVLNHHGN